LLTSHCSSGVELSIRNRAVVGSNPTSGSVAGSRLLLSLQFKHQLSAIS
jgi:hypothetical protein